MNQPLKESPDVIRLFDTMDQTRLYVEKSQLQRVVDHIDELTFTVSQLQEEIATLRQQAEMNENAPLFDEAEASVTQAKGIIERTKERIVDTAKRAVIACRDGGRNALISTLHAAHIPRLLSGLQQTLQDTERRLQGSVAKTEAVSAEWNMAKAHLRNAGRVMNGGIPQADVSAKPVKLLGAIRNMFQAQANAFGHMSHATGQLKEKIPDLDKSGKTERQSVRQKMSVKHFRGKDQGKERQPVEAAEL